MIIFINQFVVGTQKNCLAKMVLMSTVTRADVLVEILNLFLNTLVLAGLAKLFAW